MARRKNCQVCPLHQFRMKIVYGRGVIPADLLFIGEGPGKSEDALGEAFIGRSGRLLDKLMGAAADMKDIAVPKFFATNTVLCRPCNSRGGENRQPKPEEIVACMPQVMSLIHRVNPKEVVLLGKVAQAYYNDISYLTVEMQHPAFLLRTGGMTSPYFLANARILANIFWRVLCQNESNGQPRYSQVISP